MTDFHHVRHEKQQAKSQKTLWIVLVLTLLFTTIEIVGGILSNSLALLSDSAHMVTDVLALGLSMTAIYLARRPSNEKFTFGYLRFEMIASLLNGLTLCVIAVGIFVEGVRRFLSPEDVNFTLMVTIASIGLVVNVVMTFLLTRSMKSEKNLNVQSALWHFIGDLISSIGVIVAAILLYFTGWTIFDPLISVVIGAIIFRGGAKITQEAYGVLMERVPDAFDLAHIRQSISTIEGVQDVHEMHLWTISTDHHSFTAHVFIRPDIQPFCVILAVNELLANTYGIHHVTVQVEHALVHPHGEYGRAFLRKQQHETV